MGGSGPGNSIATSGGCRTWPARFKCQWTSCASGRYEAGFARGRSRLEVCGPSGPMGGNDADCGSSWQTRVRASLRNKRLHEEYYGFRHLDLLYPFYLDRGSSIVTKEVLCRADPDVQITWIWLLVSHVAALSFDTEEAAKSNWPTHLRQIDEPNTTPRKSTTTTPRFAVGNPP